MDALLSSRRDCQSLSPDSSFAQQSGRLHVVADVVEAADQRRDLLGVRRRAVDHKARSRREPPDGARDLGPTPPPHAAAVSSTAPDRPTTSGGCLCAVPSDPSSRPQLLGTTPTGHLGFPPCAGAASSRYRRP